MPIDSEGAVRKRAIRLWLILAIVVGYISIQIAKHATGWLQDVAENIVLAKLGEALLIAGILGLLVDEALKRELVRDAIAVSLGYLLPPEMKPELTWLYDQRLMAEQTFNVRLEHLPGERSVLFHGHYIRIIRNVSGEKTVPQIHGGIDEWFNLAGKTNITRCGITRNGVFTSIEPTKNLTGIGYEYDKAIELKPGEALQVDLAYTFAVPENGMDILTHNYPINCPLVTVDAPDTLRARIAFSNRERLHGGGPQSGNFSLRLPGVLLPHTDIRIYWNSASDMEARKRAITHPLDLTANS